MQKDNKKVGIVTLSGYYNYGNRLQNYAVQEVLKSLGLNVETIIFEDNSKREGIKQEVKKTKKISKIKNSLLNESLKENTKKIYDLLWNKLNKESNNRLMEKRVESIKEYSIRHIVEKKYSFADNIIPKEFSNSYDYFIVGSDQVWNPFYNRLNPIYFLDFAPSYKRISFAASFGIQTIPFEYIPIYKKWLSGFNKISVREHAGAKIIQEIVDKEAVVLTDPTMMLDKDIWLKISEKSKNRPEKKYLLTYFLGGLSYDDKRTIRKVAKQFNLEIVNVLDLKSPKYYILNPGEFIDLIDSASVFFTDSFHGVVFSILFEKPFVVIDNSKKAIASMNSRMETILSLFQFESRYINKFNSYEEIFEIDFNHTKEILNCEREKTVQFLKSMMNL